MDEVERLLESSREEVDAQREVRETHKHFKLFADEVAGTGEAQ